MLIISFDAVGDDEFDRLMEHPAFSSFSKQAAIFRGVPPIFVSNTYPIHASIVTGAVPAIHGVISNTERFPVKYPKWNSGENNIRVKALWQAAAEKGIETAAVFWPVTAFSKSVRYNIPEVLPVPGQSQIITSLMAGSKWLQFKMLLRHGKLLEGTTQPSRDDFAAACMADILRENKPGLALMHLTAYDSICHKNGKGSGALIPALESLDRNLARLLEAAGDDRDVMIFTDHSQVNVHTSVEPNDVLVKAGLLCREGDAYVPGESGCYIECCGGSSFFHAGSLSSDRVGAVKESVGKSEGFRRYLTPEELHDAGYGDVAFGFCALPGYSYVAFLPGHKADHGYPPDMPEYDVFYMARGFGLRPGSFTRGGSLLDIAPLAAKRLGVSLLTA